MILLVRTPSGKLSLSSRIFKVWSAEVISGHLKLTTSRHQRSNQQNCMIADPPLLFINSQSNVAKKGTSALSFFIS